MYEVIFYYAIIKSFPYILSAIKITILPGEKIALGVTVILAFSVFMLAIAEKMPETSESIPLIGKILNFLIKISDSYIVLGAIKSPSNRRKDCPWRDSNFGF